MIDSSRSAQPVKTAGQHSSSGGFFHVRAVAQAPGGLWTLEYGGKTVSVKTAAVLTPGAFYKGVFIQKNGRLEFILRAEGGSALSGRLPPPAGSPMPPAPLFPEPGSREYSRFILARTFFHAGRELPQGVAFGEMLRFVHTQDKREVLTRSALALRCEAKGLTLNADDYEILYALVEGYSGGGDSGGGQNRRGTRDENAPSGGEDEESAAPVDAGGREGLLLQLYNHLCETEAAWVIYPYRCTVEGRACAGSLRVLYGPEGPAAYKTAKKHVLAVHSGGDAWYFTWKAQKQEAGLKIYYTGTLDRKNLLPAVWVRKFRKLGVFCDDIVYNGECFDGFAETPEDLQRINEMA
ncbi:MAG: hypothetical protein LBQ57_03150 [Spirochaetales bacterium]|jgi:hypothetical protein|nr:hypothetical protein [Spirochaetales bacterium]